MPLGGPEQTRTFDITTDLPAIVDEGDTYTVGVTAEITIPVEEVNSWIDGFSAQSVSATIDTSIEFSYGFGGINLLADLTTESVPLVRDQPLTLTHMGVATPDYTFNVPDDVIVYAQDLTWDLTIDRGDPIDVLIQNSCLSPAELFIQTVEVTPADDEEETEPVGTSAAVELADPVVDWGGETTDITATVEADNGETPDGGFVFFLNDEEEPFDFELAEDGSATVPTPDDLDAGFHLITAAYFPVDEDEYDPSEADVVLAVYADTATDLVLSDGDDTFEPGQNIEIVEGTDLTAIATVLTVPEEAGDVIGEVQFELEGEIPLSGEGETRSPAEWDLPVDEMEPGEYTLLATFQANDAFGESTSEVIDFTIVPAASDETPAGGPGETPTGGVMPPTGAQASGSLIATALLLVGAGAGAIAFGRHRTGFRTH